MANTKCMLHMAWTDIGNMSTRSIMASSDVDSVDSWRMHSTMIVSSGILFD